MNLKTFLVSFLILMNLLGFTAMYLDKQKARKRAFRIPEATLFKIALMGGSLGSILGMYTFRHKTRHASFVYGMPAIFLLQLLLLPSVRALGLPGLPEGLPWRVAAPRW